jgi:DNA primase large subunit
MAYYKHHVYLNNNKTLHIDSNDNRPKSSSTLITIEEKDSKDLFSIPLSSIFYIQTEVVNTLSAKDPIDQLDLTKQDPYNGIVITAKDQMDK